jgi:hypothetical protein
VNLRSGKLLTRSALKVVSVVAMHRQEMCLEEVFHEKCR